MSEPRLSKILIGIIVLGILSVALIGFLSEGVDEYSVNNYDDTSLEKFRTSAENISSIVETVENQSSTLGGTTNEYDIFGGFLKSAWISLRTTGQSVNVMSGMISTGVGEVKGLNTGFSVYLRNMLIAMFLIIIIIAIFFHFIRNSSRL